MDITFLGATETVTGSRTLINHKEIKILVDCGMYQGTKAISKKNEMKFSFNPSEIDFVLLTHGHLDHCGLIPRLYKEGFRGKIYSTQATKKVAEIIMLDSAKIQFSEFINYSKDKNINKKAKRDKECLYDEKDVYACLKHFETYDYDHEICVADLKVSFKRAGHILGASGIEVLSNNKKYYFSGDIGRFSDPIEFAPYIPKGSQYITMETTYGDREHEKTDPVDELKDIILHSKQTKGNILIPSFALGRAQLVLYYLDRLFEKFPELEMPIYVDSPMTEKISRLYIEECDELKISSDEIKKVIGRAHFLKWDNELQKIRKRSQNYILISASGMLSGGRVLKHLDYLGRKEENSIVLVGFQGEGTLGRSLSLGDKNITLNKRKANIRASVFHLHSLSAHADKNELLNWVSQIGDDLKEIYLLHGEKEVQENFKGSLEDKVNANVIIAKQNLKVSL